MAYTDIDKSDEYFNTVLYTGDSASPKSITGVGFKPDFVWSKSRSTAENHNLYDAVRGGTQGLRSNSDAAETSSNTYGYVSTFNSDGVTYISGGTNNDLNNGSGVTFVNWNWLASNTTGSNTDGDITSTVSANTTSGFSIVSYTGNGSTNQTIGHGLGSVPDFIIIKQRNTSRNWPTYSKTLGNGVAFLDVIDAWASGGGYDNYWYISGMTSSTFGISNNINNNESSGTYIAYCFAEKKGFSKFGTYIGNGSSDGPFIYTGFKPAWVVMKGTNVNGWLVIDNKRTAFNSDSKFLYPSEPDAEESLSGRFDFLSNGFKLKNTWTAFNSSGQEYIYMAFAENPFVTSTGIPTTAR